MSIPPGIIIAILGLALLSGLSTVIGVVLAYILKTRNKLISVGIGFSVGIMLLISFFELLPEALNTISLVQTVVGTFCGIIFIALLNFLIPHKHITEEKGAISSRLHRVAFLAAAGLILHDFPEGFAMANSYIISPTLGLFIAISIALHNIPEEFAMAVPFIMAGKKLKFLVKLAIVSALAEPAGAIIGLLSAGLFVNGTAVSLAFAAGAMIYVSLHELLPMMRIYDKVRLFFLGIAISGVLYYLLSILFPE